MHFSRRYLDELYVRMQMSESLVESLINSIEPMCIYSR